MSKLSCFPVSHYHNAMETLVAEEIENLLKSLPLEQAEKINKFEAIAYALNRVPPLYATTLEGWYWQQERARESLADLITKAAIWGVRAATRQPNQFTTPIVFSA